MPDLSKRSHQIEIMDDLDCNGEVVTQTLRELEVINTLLGGNGVTMSGLRKLLSQRAATGHPLRITDVGCGGGDMLRLIRKWAEARRIPVTLYGIDANPNIVELARQFHADAPDIKFESADIFSEEFLAKTHDVLIGTLFFHHFTHEQLVTFFSRMRTQVKVGIVINDIHRHWLAYHSIRLLTSAFSKSSMVRHDAPVSVARAFSRDELVSILREAGFSQYTIRWMWAFRWQVVIPL